MKKEEEKKDDLRIKLDPVEKLEELSKVGFYAELRPADDSMLEPLVRLMCESKDGESDPTALTPYCTIQALTTMVQGCMYLYPLLIRVIKDRQKNADTPEVEKADEENK